MRTSNNIPHDSSHTHVSGESIFVDDRLKMKGEIFVGVMGSPVSCGVLEKIDFNEVLKIDGVYGVYSSKDFDQNLWGTSIKDQPLLVEKLISYHAEPICLLACENEDIFNIAKKQITFKIKKKAPVLSIDKAIENKEFLYKASSFKRGDVNKGLKKAKNILKGSLETGAQEHFYLENQASIVYPLEDNQFEIYTSSQHTSETQHLVARALGVPYHNINCIVKRMGGAFGGKESQAAPFAAYAAVVAKKLRRPARVVLTKDEDMKITGKRHPFKNFYEVGFDNDGKIIAIRADLFANGGAYTDLTPSILERAMFHFDGAYYLENVEINGTACKTNTHSNTAFRGFGGPQGTMTIESIMEDIGIFLKKDAAEIRELNLYREGQRDITPYGQKVEENILPEMFSQIRKTSDYKNRLIEAGEFNKTAKGALKGISLSAVKFGIAFTARFLNQGNALVNIHRDGTIQVSTGATEMGQGVNTKISQIVADVFSISPKKIRLMATSTEKNANTSPTAGSCGTDINGAAASKAANFILDRLKKVAVRYFELSGNVGIEIDITGEVDTASISFKEGMALNGKKNISFEELVIFSYLNRISLCDYAHYKTENLDFDKDKLHGRAFSYFTNGVAVSEVLIDEYTGELKVERVDILMDLGRMINPGIDEGQVTGAFVQGMGWVRMENLVYSDEGELLTHSPTTYKIPNIQDIPRTFNINFIENDQNKHNIYRSKAVGEPPFLLSVSVWTAIKHALSFRTNKIPKITSPATNEKILMELERFKNES